MTLISGIFKRKEYRMKDLPNTYEEGLEDPYKDFEVEYAQGNLISSALNPKFANITLHAPIFDIDVPHTYVPSSTPGHGHLYINQETTWEDYLRILEAMSDAGLIESGWVSASRTRGYACLRAPGVTKDDLPNRRKDTDANIEPSGTSS